MSTKRRYKKLSDLFARFGHVADERELLDALRGALIAGLPADVVSSRVRLGSVRPYGGGFMSDLVAGIEIHVPLVLKSGDERELVDACRLIERANASGTALFANSIGVRSLSHPPGSGLMVMEELTGFTPLLELVLSTREKEDAARRALANTAKKLTLLHAVPREGPPVAAPYLERLRDKLRQAAARFPKLRALLKRPGRVNGVAVAAAEVMLRRARRRFGAQLETLEATTVHGDPHLGNILTRRRGRHGQEVLFIDPKPHVGPTDRVYDFGKLMHWLEPLGWWVKAPERCTTRLAVSGARWSLTLRVPDSPIERRRNKLERHLRDGALKRLLSPEETARLHLATASAHIGLAGAVEAGDPAGEARVRAACGHALLSLSRALTT